MTAPSFPSPLLLGHRGSPKTHQENTLESFAYALGRGLDGIELDVRQTLDGTLVVHHDAHLRDGRVVAALSKKDLYRTNLPTLLAVLEWAASTGAWLNVEIKHESWRNDGIEKRTVALLEDVGLTPRTVVSSFNPVSVFRVRRTNPSVACGLLFDASLPLGLRRGKLAWPLGVAAIHPHHSLVTPELVARAHARNMRVHVWTVNDLDLAKTLLAWGVDGLIGDHPDVLLQAANRL